MTDEKLVEAVARAWWNCAKHHLLCSFDDALPTVRDAYRECARAAIAAMPQREGWRDIASAPKDKWIWLFYPTVGFEDRQCVGWWNDGQQRFVDSDDWREFSQPTHWMQLPAVPSPASPPPPPA